MEVSCRRMSLFLKDTHESYDSLRPLSNVCSFVQLHTLASTLHDVAHVRSSSQPRRSRHRPPPATLRSRNCCSSLSTLCTYEHGTCRQNLFTIQNLNLLIDWTSIWSV